MKITIENFEEAFLKFIKKFPELSMPFLDQKKYCLSLERLQLLSCKIFLSENSKHFESKIDFQKNSDGDFLIFSCENVFGDTSFLFELKYFMRGQKKFFDMQKTCDFKKFKKIAIDIKPSFSESNKRGSIDNIFFDKTLSYLNGHDYSKLHGPFMIHQAIKNIKNDKPSLKLSSLEFVFTPSPTHLMLSHS